MTVSDGVSRQLDPRVIPFDQLVGWIVTASVAAGMLLVVLVVWAAADLPGWVWFAAGPAWGAVVVFFAWLGQYWPERSYRCTSYIVDPHGLEIRQGVYWRGIISVPRSRVQHIDVVQGPMQRSYGLATLVVYTAGTEHSSVSLAGLAHPVALALRDALLPKQDVDGL